MDRTRVAKEILKAAECLLAADKTWTKHEWDVYRKEHPATKIKPKFTKPTQKGPAKKEEHTHKLPKGTPIRLYDSGPDKGMDRYTAIIDHPDWDTAVNKGEKSMLGFSESPETGVSQFGSAVEGAHLGKKIKFTDLPKDLQEHVRRRIEED